MGGRVLRIELASQTARDLPPRRATTVYENLCLQYTVAENGEEQKQFILAALYLPKIVEYQLNFDSTVLTNLRYQDKTR